jgi:hypothetical protein
MTTTTRMNMASRPLAMDLFLHCLDRTLVGASHNLYLQQYEVIGGIPSILETNGGFSRRDSLKYLLVLKHRIQPKVCYIRIIRNAV